MNDFDILKQDELSRKEQVKQTLEQIGRPSLVRRIGSGLLDLLFIFVLFALIELLAAGVFFRPLGYFDAQGDINTIFAESGLYLRQNGMNVLISNAYDENKSVEENYDVPITKYYTEDARCIENNMLSAYDTAKLTSGHFVRDENGDIVRKSTVSDETLKTFYETEYQNAVAFLRQDADYIAAVNKTFTITAYSLLISLLIASAVFYFAIPLLRKNGETLGQIICKICLVDARNVSRVKKVQVVVRSMIVVVLNFLIPFWIFYFFSNVTLLTVLISFAIMCLTRYNRGVQDFLSQTQVIFRHEAFRWNNEAGNEVVQ